MNKTVSSLLLAGALLLGSVAPVVANAATGDTGITTGGTGKTTSTITFTKPTSTTTPVDPDKPGTTDPGDNGGVPEPGGDLTFLYVSKGIGFGSHQQTDTNDPAPYVAKTVDNTRTGATDPDPIAQSKNLIAEVSDTRGSNAGWSVTVSADKMVSADSDLAGATLSLGQASIQNSSNTATAMQAKAVSGLATDGTTAPIFNAPAKSGMLASTFQITPDTIKLGVPANVKEGTYSGNINWTLSATPTASLE